MIYIASDYSGFAVKTHLIPFLKRKLKQEVIDEGPFEYFKGDDYPIYARKVCEKITDENFGILICDTGIGMSIAANRYVHIRAALCSSIFEALRAREHNNANILVLGSESLDLSSIESIVRVFFETAFSNEERYIRRVNELSTE